MRSLGFDIAENLVGSDAGEISDFAVNNCLADDRLPAIFACICLISWRVIDTMFLCVDRVSRFRRRLLEWKHDNRACCLACADELVRGCSVPKRKSFDNASRYHPLGDSIEQGFCSDVDFTSVRQVMRKHGTGDNEIPANAQILDSLAPSFSRSAAASTYSTDSCQANSFLEARELDDDEAAEFLRALEDLEFAAARQDLAANFGRMSGPCSVYVCTGRDC